MHRFISLNRVCQRPMSAQAVLKALKERDFIADTTASLEDMAGTIDATVCSSPMSDGVFMQYVSLPSKFLRDEMLIERFSCFLAIFFFQFLLFWKNPPAFRFSQLCSCIHTSQSFFVFFGIDLNHQASPSVYCGYDPTAPSLHVGNLVSLMALAHFSKGLERCQSDH